MSRQRISIDEAEGHLAELIKRVQKGEEIVIGQKDQPQVKLVICNVPKTGRVAGLHQNQVHLSEDFNDSLDESYWVGDR